MHYFPGSPLGKEKPSSQKENVKLAVPKFDSLAEIDTS
jgi:hypothetical protein